MTQAPPADAITVVIPAYGAAVTIGEAVSTALVQNGGDVRIIVILDDQCDETAKIVSAFGDERVTVVRNDVNMGAQHSRNRGLGLAGTPWITFLDADDFYRGDFLGPLVARMVAEHADIGFGPSDRWNPHSGRLVKRLPDFRDCADVFYRWMGLQQNVNTASVVWSTEYLRSIGGWDVDLKRNQDGELALRAMLMGARFAQSQEGAGVWRDDRKTARISNNPQAVESLFSVLDKFDAMESKVVPDQVRRRALARYCMKIAHLAFSTGQDALGRRALERCRGFGGRPSDSNLRHYISSSMRFLPSPVRLPLWRAFRWYTARYL